ncbi:spore germination protein [Brevibacillus fluminis]|uniref:Spore germination protein n=1 Tax=Brevibacillus fluminis TaxID=511487 RepID=A0A3M8DJV5_9BACL|nr:spore germination protein [Brevibacillus fluminis]RNB87397.1 spore germination protein [Brevibacillus fluminis]
MNDQLLFELFDGCEDVSFSQLKMGFENDHASALIIYCDSLCDLEQVNRLIFPAMRRLSEQQLPPTLSDIEQSISLPLRMFDPDDLEHEIVDRVFAGELLIYWSHIDRLMSLDMANHPKRSPEEPNTEISIRGAKDGFIEQIGVNIGLIRQRVRSNSLHYQQFIIGKRSQTRVGIMYVHDICAPDLVEKIRERLNQFQIDAVISSTNIEEFLVKRTYSFFPEVAYTGRPDYAVSSLMAGRVLILVDGSPTVLIAPANFTYLLSSPEDTHSFFYFVWLERLLRFLGFILAVFLPGFWVALSTYHQDQLPFTLLATVVVARQGIPMPVPLEALLIIILFELFKEAGLRLPLAVGQTLSVVGGLIIGQAAISAGLASSVMLVVVAASTVATFTFTSQSIVGSMSIVRLFVLLLSSALGMYGFLLALMAIITYLVNLRSFGVPYLAPFSPLIWQDLFRAILTIPTKLLNYRPKLLRPTDQTRQGE